MGLLKSRYNKTLTRFAERVIKESLFTSTVVGWPCESVTMSRVHTITSLCTLPTVTIGRTSLSWKGKQAKFGSNVIVRCRNYNTHTLGFNVHVYWRQQRRCWLFRRVYVNFALMYQMCLIVTLFNVHFNNTVMLNTLIALFLSICQNALISSLIIKVFCHPSPVPK